MCTDNKLEACPFSYQVTKKGMVHISFENRVVTVLNGKDAAKFADKASSSDEAGQQMLMAKATGHFKHGSQ